MKALFNSGLKSFLRTSAPGLYEVFRKIWLEHKNRRLAAISQALLRRYGLTVQGGPFAGMRYASRAVGSMLTPKLLGSYEAELHDAITDLLRNEYHEIVDIGCAEGYYAVGLALREPRATVYAFDLDPVGRELCKEMACANGVGQRIVVSGKCELDSLRRFGAGRTLVICDCEGYEVELLQPDLLAKLQNCDLVVETHDFIESNISNTLISRFERTHDITLIETAGTDPSLYPPLRLFGRWDRRLAMDEGRETTNGWLVMRSRRFRCATHATVVAAGSAA
jgi:hypothetical protein